MASESNKTFAGIGSILLCVPFANIVGIFLVLRSMKELSEHYKVSLIFDDFLKRGLFCSALSSIFGVLTLLSTDGSGPEFLVLSIIPFIIFALLGAYLMIGTKAFYALAERSNTPLFNTAGKLIRIGAVLSIIIIGLFVMYVGFIIAALGFFSLKSGTTSRAYGSAPPPPAYGSAPPPPVQQPPPTTSSKANFCSKCGARLESGNAFCSNCGKQS
ncbi:MAG: DUF996 domain-containing protein [Nitrososphaerota archaeon]|jgi:uncharacterized membrane protein|nr:DUF996 domain-containing protein [Nitrososphaerota archaeon]